MASEFIRRCMTVRRYKSKNQKEEVNIIAVERRSVTKCYF